MDNQKQNYGKKGNEKGRQVDSDKDQPNEVPGQPSQDRMPTKEPVPSFNEGERRPAPIESTANDRVRSTPPSPRATSGERPDDVETHTKATMPPDEGREPNKRNTM
jgi:hypothetical protein